MAFDTPVPESLDEILLELAEVTDRLLTLPEDALEERVGLRQRRTALRDAAGRARRHALRDADPDQLRARLRHLERRLLELGDQRLSTAHAGGDAGGGHGGPFEVLDLNRRIAAAQGRDEVLAEIRRVRAALDVTRR